MGAETDLWDDSALVTAFDKAMAKYKAMHKVTNQGDPSEEEAITSHVDGNEPTIADELIRDTDVNEKCEGTTLAEKLGLACDATEILPTQESQVKLEAHPQESGFQTLMAQEAIAGYSSQAMDYSQLLNQYYVLEEQRQKVLQQLYQSSVENPQASSYMAWNPSSYTSEPNPVPTQSSSSMSSLSPCYPYYTCPCSGATCSVPPCVLGGQCMLTDTPSTTSHPRQEVVKIAMEAMEKALSSTKAKTISESSEVSGDNKKKNSHVRPEAKPLQDVSTDMDMGLVDVLNAWYTAGFYTAKYLVEQSSKKGPG